MRTDKRYLNTLSLRLRALLPWDRFAAHQLGAMYATGSRLPKDERSAIRWYRRGARRGDPESQYDLGFMLLLGEGVPVDRRAALDWLTRAAQGGEYSAAQLLADLYAQGLYGVDVDRTKSDHWAVVAEGLRVGA